MIMSLFALLQPEKSIRERSTFQGTSASALVRTGADRQEGKYIRKQDCLGIIIERIRPGTRMADDEEERMPKGEGRRSAMRESDAKGERKAVVDK
jgi:hypothetical protein